MSWMGNTRNSQIRAYHNYTLSVSVLVHSCWHEVSERAFCVGLLHTISTVIWAWPILLLKVIIPVICMMCMYDVKSSYTRCVADVTHLTDSVTRLCVTFYHVNTAVHIFIKLGTYINHNDESYRFWRLKVKVSHSPRSSLVNAITPISRTEVNEQMCT